jgi:hypothetical protein
MLNAALLDSLREGYPLATAVAPSHAGRRAWVGVHPFKVRYFEEWPEDVDALPWKFRTHWIEVDASFDLHKYDLHPEYIHTLRDVTALSEAELEETLTMWIGDPNQLRWPSEVDYPL